MAHIPSPGGGGLGRGDRLLQENDKQYAIGVKNP